jgi:hypothetical protein
MIKSWILLLLCIQVVNGSFAKSKSKLLIRGGEDDFEVQRRQDFSVGKDRELFHASVDLKWLFDVLCDRNTWIDLFDNIVQRFLRLSRGYEAEFQYRDFAIQLLREIKQMEPKNCSLRYYFIVNRI